MEGRWQPLDLADLTPLAASLAAVQGSGGEAWVTVAPAVPPTIEVRKRFGRRGHVVASWFVGIQDWSRRKGAPTEHALFLRFPGDRRLGAFGVALPPGTRVEIDDPGETHLMLPERSDALATVTVAVAVLRVVLAGHVPDAWRWRAGDTTLPLDLVNRV